VEPSPDIVFTSRTEPCAVTTHVGVTIHVVLDTGFNWDDPKSDSAVIRVGGIQRPPSGGLRADLSAAAIGQAAVTTTGGVACAPGQPCPALARLWRLDITVTGSAPPPKSVTVTEADSGHSVILHKGDGLDVELSGPSNYTWTGPASSDPGVLQQVSAKSGSAGFLAVGTGRATVRATDNPNCYPQCLAPSRLFEVSVTVVG
jgi:hypothetical protein